jgi:hypothetical protein
MKTVQLAALRIFRKRSKLGIAVSIISVIQASIFITNISIPRVESEAVEQTVAGLSQSDKWLSINLGDSTKLGEGKINDLVIYELAKVEDNQPRHSIVLRPISDEFHGRFQLIGTEQIESETTLTSGRIPNKCDLSACEVIVVNPDGLSRTPAGFEVVGIARVSDNSSLLKAIEPQTPLLITSDLTQILNLKSVEGYPGSELWAVEISKQGVSRLGLTEYLDSLNETDQLIGLESTRLLVDGPIGKLEETKSQVQVLSNRILSLEITICLIASFSIFVIALASRKSNGEFVKSINRISPGLISKQKFIGALAFLISAAGSVFGLLIGALFTWLLYQQVNFQYLNTRLFLSISFTAILLIIAGLVEKREFRPITVLVGLLPLTYFLISNKLDLWLCLIPISSAITLLFLNQLINQRFRNQIAKNFYLSKSSHFITLGIVSALLISTLFSAITYLSSLNRNVLDSATFESPIATRITMSSESQPMQNNSFVDYKKYANGAEVFGVRKLSTTYFLNSVNSYPTQLVGVNPEVWNFGPDISDQTGIDLKTSSELLPISTADFGIDVQNIETLSVQVSGLNPFTTLGVWVLNDRLESKQIQLQVSGEKLTTFLPENSASLLGFQITEMPDYKDRRDHAVGEGKNALPAPSGKLTISNLELDGIAINFSQISEAEYSVINGPIYMSLVSKPSVIPAIIDAKTNGLKQEDKIQLRVTGESYIELDVVGVSNNLPTVPMQFALINDSVLTQYLAAVAPELLHINEVWISNELLKSLSKDKELYGLTAFSQKELINKFQSPTNAKWSSRALILICLIALLLYLLILYFIASEIFKDEQFTGWYSAGNPIGGLVKVVANKTILIVSSAAIISGILGTWLIRLYIEKIAYNINGEIAYPKLITHFDLKSQILVLIIFSALTFSIIKLVGNRLIRRVRQS